MITEIFKEEHQNGSMEAYIVPNGVRKIGEGAFRNCGALKKIYLPSSVEEVGDNAFLGCKQVEIYCEDEPKAGWLEGMCKVTVSYEIVTPEDDAFNFHRSGGSFTTTRVEREEERLCHWNPENRPVYTHVARSVTEGWKVPRRFVLLHRNDEPKSALMRRALKELTSEHPELRDGEPLWVNALTDHLANTYEYGALPALFYGEEKLYEASSSDGYEAMKAAAYKAMLTVLAAKKVE